MNTINFRLQALNCGACVNLATSRLKRIPGVQDVEIDLATGNSKVDSDQEINLEMVKKALADTVYNIAE